MRRLSRVRCGYLCVVPASVTAVGVTSYALSQVKSIKVRRVDLLTGDASLFAGMGEAGVSSNVEGPTTSTGMNGPHCVWLDSLGRMYVTETDGNKIKRVDADSRWYTTIAGSEGAVAANRGGRFSTGVQFEMRTTNRNFVDMKSSLHVANMGDFATMVRPSTAPSASSAAPNLDGDGHWRDVLDGDGGHVSFV